MSPKLPVALAASLVLLASCVTGQSTTIGGTTYTLITRPMDFNTLATSKTGCPWGSVFSGFEGDDADAAIILAPNLTIWVDEDTIAGKVPVKAEGASVMSYVDNTPLPTRPYICKSMTSVVISNTLYVLITAPAMDFNTLATTNGAKGCPSGFTFSGYTGDDATAANTLASTITIFVNAVTQGGQVPVKLAGASVVSYVDNSAQPTSPFICKAALSSPAPPSPRPSLTLPIPSPALPLPPPPYPSTSYPPSYPTPGESSSEETSTEESSTSGLDMPMGYELMLVSVTNFTECFTVCEDLGMRFVSFESSNAGDLDAYAVNRALEVIPSVYVNDDIVDGLCPAVEAADPPSMDSALHYRRLASHHRPHRRLHQRCQGAVTYTSCNLDLAFVCGPVLEEPSPEELSTETK